MQIVWTVELEVYSWIFGENFAYRVAHSPGSFLVFIRKFFITEGIIYEMADEAYEIARDSLIDEVQMEADSRYLSVYINPDL